MSIVPADAADALDVASSVAGALGPGAGGRGRGGAGPRAAAALIDASGLLAITVPAEHGGLGAGPVLLTEVVRRIAVADPALAQTPQAHFLFVDVLAAIGTAEQQ